MSALKKIFKLFPESFRTRFKHRYYLNKLKKSSINDEKDLLALKLLVKRGAVAIDIGANYGLYTRFLSEISGINGHIYSFEPVPETYKILFYNINQIGLKNVTVYNMAASDKDGEAYITIPAYEDGSENFYQASLENADKNNGIKIIKQSLDNLFLNKIKVIDFIKIDVEGHELQVLKGAEKIIEKHHPAMMIEINDGFAPGSTGSKVKGFLENFNYKMHCFDKERIRETDGKESGVNFIFT